MENGLFPIMLIVCVLAHIIRAVYEILKHKKKLSADKRTFIFMFINMLLLWISWFLLCVNDPYSIELNRYLRYLGILIFIAGIALFLIALFTIKTLETYDGDLITRGIYSKFRHPMYLGFICWLVGLPVYFGAVFSFVLAFVFIANILFWKYLEEKELVQRFSSYAEYKKTTLF